MSDGRHFEKRKCRYLKKSKLAAGSHFDENFVRQGL